MCGGKRENFAFLCLMLCSGMNRVSYPAHAHTGFGGGEEANVEGKHVLNISLQWCKYANNLRRTDKYIIFDFKRSKQHFLHDLLS